MGRFLVSMLIGALVMFYAEDWKNFDLSAKQVLSVVQNGTRMPIFAKD